MEINSFKTGRKSATVQSYIQLDYPEQLAENYLEQLNKVYSTCINPTQYLPLLFTPENSALILQVGTYASEQQHPYTSSAWYTTIGEGTIPQYCKYVTLDKGIQIKQLVFVSS